MRNLIANWKSMTIRNKLIMVVMFAAIFALGAISLFGFPALPPAGGKDAPSESAPSSAAADVDPSIEFSESQKAAIDGYGEAEEELVARLQNGLWSTLDEKTVITFTARTFTTSSSGKVSEPRPYAIVSHTDLTQSPYESEYAISTVLAVETDDGVSILNLQRIPQGTVSSYAIDWPDIANGTLLQVGLARTVRIDGDVSKLGSILDQDTLDGILSEVQGQAVEYYPTATVATWSGAADVDWNERSVKTSFTLNNSSKTIVNIERKIPDGNGKA